MPPISRLSQGDKREQQQRAESDQYCLISEKTRHAGSIARGEGAAENAGEFIAQRGGEEPGSEDETDILDRRQLGHSREPHRAET